MSFRAAFALTAAATLTLAGCAGGGYGGGTASAPAEYVPADQPTETAVDNYAEGGVAINGYDTVAYHTENAPVEGSADYTADYDGVTWRFSSAQNRDLFTENPIAYVPAYGGYCAYAVSAAGDNGRKVATRPELFTVVDGQLYLNYNKTVHERFQNGSAEHIAQGTLNWDKIRLQ